MSAKAIATEVAGKVRTVTFGSGDDALVLDIPRKWKRFKFMRAINSGDLMGALEAVFGLDRLAEIEDIDVDEDEFGQALEVLGKALGGEDLGN